MTEQKFLIFCAKVRVLGEQMGAFGRIELEFLI